MSDAKEHVEGDLPTGISRRTVTRAIAWAVPVIAVAAPVPAFAASQAALGLTGDACKLPGNSDSRFKGYVFGVTAQNTFDVPITIQIDRLILNGTDLGQVAILNLNPCEALGVSAFTIPAKTTFSKIAFLTENAANSENGSLTISYTIIGGPGGEETVTARAPATPPLQGEACADFTPDEKGCIEAVLTAA
jgi:hypothetical protein